MTDGKLQNIELPDRQKHSGEDCEGIAGQCRHSNNNPWNNFWNARSADHPLPTGPLDTGERDDRFFSREPSVRELAEVAWREHLRVTVLAEAVLAEAGDHSARIGSIVLHEPPG